MPRFSHPVFILKLVVVLVLSSCVGYERKAMPEADPQAVYRDYIVWGDEESGIITVRLQYKRGGRDGDSFLLEEPAKTEFDGEMIEPDSAGFNGAYYEVIRWVNDFDGSHRIVFTDEDGKQYKTEFVFPVLSLKTQLPALIPRDDLFFEINGVSPGDRIRVLITDTSFYGQGIEKIDTAVDGRIFIPGGDFAALKNGPVYLEISREEDIFLDDGKKRRGHLSLSYTLKKELILQDSAGISPLVD